ncbi:RICIN domain-containing protein [Streptomyces sp. ME19-01-6]|nr:RICIN domain-containing protein [Streptomyces sp. ME19-01-6]MDX3233750.1 RICIN domain-containing protein [Streptomyces sp. ME19-01-6]
MPTHRRPTWAGAELTTSFTGELIMRKSPTPTGLSTAPSVQVWSDSTSGRGGTADGTNIFQWTCTGGANQKWRVEDMGDDTSRLVNVATGKVMDTADCGTADGADVRQLTWLNNNCQQWRLVPTTA